MKTSQALPVALVPRFLGTNCEEETLLWLEDNLELNATYLDATNCGKMVNDQVFASPNSFACVVIPGGFSFGDYLRAGALASRSAEMHWIARLANHNVPVLGICNGFQILCESGLLPGVLLRNQNKQHCHFPVQLSFAKNDLSQLAEPTRSTNTWPVWLPQELKTTDSHLAKIFGNFSLPLSCGMGMYFAGAASCRPVLRYVNNEVGSQNSIAGITNNAGNVLGLMPHPERASEATLGSTKGLLFLYGLAQNRNLKIRSNSALASFAQEVAAGEKLAQREKV